MSRMKEVLHTFLSQFKELTEVERAELANLMTVKEVKKNTVLVKQGQYCNLCYFVLKGCLRQYIIKEDTEKTIGIYTEEQAVNFFSDEHNVKASESFVVSVEDSILLIGNPEKDKELYQKFPTLTVITRKFMESDLDKMQDSFAKFITFSPEERYLNLLEKRPEIMQRVPQTVVASYLGITPESLSRIRKRIKSK